MWGLILAAMSIQHTWRRYAGRKRAALANAPRNAEWDPYGDVFPDKPRRQSSAFRRKQPAQETVPPASYTHPVRDDAAEQREEEEEEEEEDEADEGSSVADDDGLPQEPDEEQREELDEEEGADQDAEQDEEPERRSDYGGPGDESDDMVNMDLPVSPVRRESSLRMDDVMLVDKPASAQRRRSSQVLCVRGSRWQARARATGGSGRGGGSWLDQMSDPQSPVSAPAVLGVCVSRVSIHTWAVGDSSVRRSGSGMAHGNAEGGV